MVGFRNIVSDLMRFGAQTMARFFAVMPVLGACKATLCRCSIR